MFNRSKKICAIALSLALVSATGLTGCGTAKDANNGGSGEGGSTANFGSVEIPVLDGSLCGAPFYIAEKNGYFKEEGLDAKLIAADTETRKIGLNNGDYPITNGDFMYFQSIEQDVNVSVVEGLHNGCIQVLAAADSDVNSVEDLAGANIGVDEIGGPPYEAASIWLENHGIKVTGSDSKVKFLPYSDGNLELQALQNGEIKAAAIWDPIASEAVKSGKAKTLLNIGTDDIFAGKYCCFVYASNKVLEEKPAEIAAIIRALRKAEQFINDNTEEAVKIIAENNYSEINDPKLAADLLKEYAYPTQEEFAAGKRGVKDTVEYFADQLYKIGYLSTESSKLIDKLYREVDVEAK